MWSLVVITEVEGCGGRRVLVLLADTSGAESIHRCETGGGAMRRRGRRIKFVAKFCDEGGELLAMKQELEHLQFPLAISLGVRT